MSTRRGRKKGSGRTRIGIEPYLISSEVPEEVFFKLNEILYDQRFSVIRKNPRIAVSLPLFWKFGDRVQKASTYTLSRDGMFIKTPTPVDEGCEIKISFFLPDNEEPILVSAKVLRRISPEEAQRQGLLTGMAVSFQNLDQRLQKKLDLFIQKRIKSRASPKWI